MSEPQQPRRVVVTGLGTLSVAGIGQQAFFEGLCNLAPQQPPLTIDNFDPDPLFDSPKERRRHDRFSQLALAAAAEAIAQASSQAGDLNCDPARIGVHIGTGWGGMATAESQMLLNYRAPRRISPFAVPNSMTNAASASVSMRYGFQGPSYAITTACAAGAQNIGNALYTIRWGQSDIVLAGGADACNTPLVTQGFANMRATSTLGISRPFDAQRDGFVLAEGAAVLVLEEREHALARNATILAEALGYGTNADAYHITAPRPNGAGVRACMELALQDASLIPADIGHINAHGTSTPLNDANEAEAIHQLFGSPGPLVTSIKGVTGHSQGAAGALEAAAVVLTLQRQLIPPTANQQTPDPELAPIQLVTEATEWQPGMALSNSFGFGGHNASLVFGL